MLHASIPYELQKACELLFLDAEGVEEAFLVRLTVAGSHEVKGRWTQHQSELLKESLCKGVFERLFEWLVRQVNSNISNPEGMEQFIGESESVLQVSGRYFLEYHALCSWRSIPCAVSRALGLRGRPAAIMMLAPCRPAGHLWV